MPVKKKASAAKAAAEKVQKRAPRAGVATHSHDVGAVLGSLRRVVNKSTLEGMARYGIPQGNAFGVPISKIQQLAKSLGRSHELAGALWETGQYEARLLACFVDEPERVTPAQMDRWCRDFDSWAICDTVCFKLFDQVEPAMAFRKVEQWCGKHEEFVKRGGFALMACLALHGKGIEDEPFVRCLPLIELGASDERNFVKKGVSWALRSVGRRSLALNADAVGLSERLLESPHAAARWVGKDALRDISKPSVAKRLKG